MSFIEELKSQSEQAFKKWLDTFVEELKPKLKESAEKGYEGYRIRFDDRKDAHFFAHDCLTKELEEELGCKVFRDTQTYQSIIGTEYIQRFLVIRWVD
jgi:hypothetical protein